MLHSQPNCWIFNKTLPLQPKKMTLIPTSMNFLSKETNVQQKSWLISQESCVSVYEL